MKRSTPTGLAALGLLLSASAAQANSVNFNGLPNGNAANPYAENGATFFVAGGFNTITNLLGAGSLCASAYSNSVVDCSLALEVTFANPVAALGFTFAGNNNPTIGADIGDVQVFSGASLLGIADVIVQDGNTLSFDLVNLGGFSNVTRLLITSTDSGGVVYDDFIWQAAAVGVPEPAAWLMLIAGFGCIGAAMRRRTHWRARLA